ncbi:hypothetical protein C8R43DRAFT_955770 [Mycena crocata]|nr:hypothetical protein C8R43DRAFT_955770 [Mycena crocata]
MLGFEIREGVNAFEFESRQMGLKKKALRGNCAPGRTCAFVLQSLSVSLTYGLNYEYPHDLQLGPTFAADTSTSAVGVIQSGPPIFLAARRSFLGSKSREATNSGLPPSLAGLKHTMRARAWMIFHHSRWTASASGMPILTAASIRSAGRSLMRTGLRTVDHHIHENLPLARDGERGWDAALDCLRSICSDSVNGRGLATTWMKLHHSRWTARAGGCMDPCCLCLIVRVRGQVEDFIQRLWTGEGLDHLMDELPSPGMASAVGQSHVYGFWLPALV